MSRTAALLVVTIALAAVAGCLAGSSTPPKQAAQSREYYVFNAALDFNETLVRLPHDVFSPSQITVNQGDTVTIHFYNTEDEESHTFTMDAPYALNKVVPAGGEANITFTASTSGIFPYRCMEHQPTMTGYLVVLGG
jgi:plastocyanin